MASAGDHGRAVVGAGDVGGARGDRAAGIGSTSAAVSASAVGVEVDGDDRGALGRRSAAPARRPIPLPRR